MSEPLDFLQKLQDKGSEGLAAIEEAGQEFIESATTPLADLYLDKYRQQNLQFPKNVEGSAEEKTWVRFDIQRLSGFKVKKQESRSLVGDVGGSGSFLGDLVASGVEKASALARTAISAPINIASGVANEFLSDLPPGLSDIGRKFVKPEGQKTEGYGSIVLYAPPSQQISTNFQWENKAASAGGGFLQASLAQKSLNNETISSLKNRAAQVAGAGLASTAGALTGAGSEVGQQILGRQQGLAFNNHLTSFFQGVGFRSFSFNFMLAPRNPEESREIQKIVRLFKYAAAPAVVDGEYGLFFQYPQVFNVSYHNEDQTQKYLQSALTDIVVDYSPAGQNTTFYDKYPAAVSLTLTFTELAIINKDRVDEGY